jgi:hypothetical protein
MSDIIMEQTASWVAKKIRDRERKGLQSTPTAVFITDDMKEEHDILVRGLSRNPGRNYDLLGVYVNPTREIILEDLQEFYGAPA